jgi:hypothetical protein
MPPAVRRFQRGIRFAKALREDGWPDACRIVDADEPLAASVTDRD